MEKIIGLEDVIPGDVLLFKPADRLGSLIALLTCSKVSHAALAYYDKENETDLETKKQMIQSTRAGVMLATIQSLLCDRDVYVMRLQEKCQNADFDLDPVLKVGKKYADLITQYNWDNLALLGFYYITSDIPFSISLQNKLVEHRNLVEVIVLALIEVYKHYLDKAKLVCSELVYDCFEEAGDKYTLHYKEDALMHTLLGRMRGQQGVEEITVKSLCKNAHLGMSTDEYINRLDDMFQKEQAKNITLQAETFTNDFMQMTGEICLTFCCELLPEWKDMREATLDKVLDAMLAFFKTIPSPENLRSDMTNLVPIGMIKTNKK